MFRDSKDSLNFYNAEAAFGTFDDPYVETGTLTGSSGFVMYLEVE